MIELADIFRKYGQEYLSLYGQDMLPSHTRTLYDVANCQTEYFGGHVYECDHCGFNHYLYHSCCNRNCPKCQNNNSKKWLEKRKAEILPVNYYHVVFTLPKNCGM